MVCLLLHAHATRSGMSVMSTCCVEEPLHHKKGSDVTVLRSVSLRTDTKSVQPVLLVMAADATNASVSGYPLAKLAGILQLACTQAAGPSLSSFRLYSQML